MRTQTQLIDALMNYHTLSRFLVMLALLAAPVAAPARAEDPAAEMADKMISERPKTVGIELGVFVLKDYRPIQGEKVRVGFTLYASTPMDEKDSFMRRLEHHEMRVRDQVITAMRLANPEEFQDPKLRLIRRRLQLRLGRALPELAIDEVYFSDFRYTVD